MADVTAAFRAQAVRVGASVHATTHAEASARAVEILREEGCRSAAVAAVVPDRSEFVRALRAAGLSEVPTATLWPTRRADGGISAAKLGVAETGSALLPPATGRVARDNAARVPADGFTNGGADGKALPPAPLPSVPASRRLPLGMSRGYHPSWPHGRERS